MTRAPRFDPNFLLCIPFSSFQAFNKGEVGDAFIERALPDAKESSDESAAWRELQPGDTCEYEVGEHNYGLAEIVSISEDAEGKPTCKVKKVS